MFRLVSSSCVLVEPDRILTFTNRHGTTVTTTNDNIGLGAHRPSNLRFPQVFTGSRIREPGGFLAILVLRLCQKSSRRTRRNPRLFGFWLLMAYWRRRPPRWSGPFGASCAETPWRIAPNPHLVGAYVTTLRWRPRASIIFYAYDFEASWWIFTGSISSSSVLSKTKCRLTRVQRLPFS